MVWRGVMGYALCFHVEIFMYISFLASRFGVGWIGFLDIRLAWVWVWSFSCWDFKADGFDFWSS